MSSPCASATATGCGSRDWPRRDLHAGAHLHNSYSFVMADRVFTGDTLLIRGTGRTDFQNGDARAQYESLQRLLSLPEETSVFPAHDYKGDTVSTIGEERRCNPRLQVRSADEYVALMNGLNLPNPKMMDVAVPANMRQGLLQAEIARRGWAVSATEAAALIGTSGVALIDLRERGERERYGVIPGSLHVPYSGVAGEHFRRRRAARAGRSDQQAVAVLLRLRRTQRDGGAGGAGCRPVHRLPYRGWHERVEADGRGRGTLRGCRRRPPPPDQCRPASTRLDHGYHPRFRRPVLFASVAIRRGESALHP